MKVGEWMSGRSMRSMPYVQYSAAPSWASKVPYLHDDGRHGLPGQGNISHGSGPGTLPNLTGELGFSICGWYKPWEGLFGWERGIGGGRGRLPNGEWAAVWRGIRARTWASGSSTSPDTLQLGSALRDERTFQGQHALDMGKPLECS